jgi:hypothetical protein
MTRQSVWGISVKPSPMFGYPIAKKKKRTATAREKQIAYERQNGKCAICNKKLDPIDMEWGHRRAHSKGGSAARGALVHHKCNKLQGTEDMSVIRRKLGYAKSKKERPEEKQKVTQTRME